ncbi:aldehyde dehydrogenase family protein [Vibrio sp. PP-XX7]
MTSTILEKAPWKGHFFNGQWQPSTQSRDVMEPATQKPLTQTAIASGEDIYLACIKAKEAQKTWAKIAPRERSMLFLKAADF